MSSYTTKQHAEAPKWLKYEVIMLLKARRLHDKGLKEIGFAKTNEETGYPRTVWTCGLESFLVHYRNLKQFLNNQRYPLDVKGEHYSSTWTGNQNIVETYPKREDKRIDQLLAHISYTRSDNDIDRGNWDVHSMEANLRNALTQFLRQVDAQYFDYFNDVRDLLDATTSHKPLVVTSNSTATIQTFEIWWEN